MPADDDKTMNAVLLDRVAGGWHIGGCNAGVLVRAHRARVSEAGLLFIAAQAGFVDGPRVMANMAVDSWLPHRFAALSERLSMQNGVILMGGTSIAALLYTHGNVEKLVVMYSINVFLTFSLSNLGMARFWIQHRKEHARLAPAPAGAPHRPRALRDDPHRHRASRSSPTAAGSRWSSPALLVALCFGIKRHYDRVVAAIRRLDVELPDPLPDVSQLAEAERGEPRRGGEPRVARSTARQPVAILFVGGYGGLGRHALLTLLRMFPGHFKGVVFCSVAIIDSGNFKGIAEVHELERADAAGARQVRAVRRVAGPAGRERVLDRHRGRRRGGEDRRRS